MVLVSVFDSKSEIYSAPQPSQTKASAIREFSSLVNDGGKSMISQHPEDFTLFLVGEWLDRVPVEDVNGDNFGNVLFTARLVACKTFECLAKGIDLVKKG